MGCGCKKPKEPQTPTYPQPVEPPKPIEEPIKDKTE